MKEEAIEFQGEYCAQGDLNIFRVDAIPKGLKEESPSQVQGMTAFVLAHSETGHNHVVDGNCVRVFRKDEFEAYMEVKKPCEIVHLKDGPHKHKAFKVQPGVYRLTNQMQYSPKGWQRALD